MSVLSFFLFILYLIQSALGSVVLTTSGPIRGQFVQSGDVSYYSYRGIPYAEPPVGDLRFKPPVPKASWNITFNATEFGPVCPQKPGIFTLQDMSEDCLNLNIYVPASSTCQPLPVLIETPSGEFRKLSGRDDVFGPKFYMEYGVVFITFQYRLGALGFLSVMTEEAPGNAGLKDALLLLKWVQNNIHAFGGDPNNVSFGGNSAGSVIVHYLMLSKQSKGLFHRAFLRSGSALGYRFLNRYPVETALALGSQMGYKTNNTFKLIQKLRQADTFEIINATAEMETDDKRKGFRPFSPFVIVVEPESADAVITRNPLDITESGMPQNVPVIVGFNAQDGISIIPSVRQNLTTIEILNANFELCIPSDIEYPYGSKESVKLAAAIKDFYFNGQDISEDTIQNYIDLISDTQFTFATDRWIRIHTGMTGSAPVFYYMFDFDGELNFFKLMYNITDLKGAAHVDDFGYMFSTDITKPLLSTANNQSLQAKDVIMTLNTNFIKYGTPTLPSSVKWSDYKESGSYLILDNQPRLVQGSPMAERFEFWYKIYEDYDVYLKKNGVVEAKIIP